MAITHAGRVESRPHGTGWIGFAQREADRIGASIQQFLRYHRVEACKCGDPTCPGWQVVYKITGRGRGEA